jgi:hypothetical protein
MMYAQAAFGLVVAIGIELVVAVGIGLVVVVVL